jgi:ATP-binding cassette subfamily B protein
VKRKGAQPQRLGEAPLRNTFYEIRKQQHFLTSASFSDLPQDAQNNEKDTQIFDGRLFRRIVGYLAPYKGWVGLAFTLVVGTSFLGPLRPKLVQVAIDSYIVPGDLEGLRSLILLLLVVLVGEGVLKFASGYLTKWIGQHAIHDLRTKVFRHIHSQPLKFFDETPIGRLITRCTSDVESLSDVLSAGIVTILGDCFRLIFISYFMFSLNWQLALVTIGVMPLMVWATFWFRRMVRDQYRATRKQVSRINSFIQEHVTGMPVVQVFGREKEEMRRFEDINDAHREAQVNTVFYFALFWPMVDIITSLALGLVLWYGGLRAMSSTLTVGVLIAFIQYARQFFRPIRNLSDQYNTLQRAMAGAERIFGLLDKDYALEEAEEPVAPSRLEGRIEFRNVWFTYDDVDDDRVDEAVAAAQTNGRSSSNVATDGNPSETNGLVSNGHSPEDGGPEWILKGVSFVAEPGETTALVGATGAGKTTIIRLLLRFYEIQRGEILVDGVDIRKYDMEALRRRIGLVLQDVFLFSGSIERNLTLEDPDIEMDAVRRAADAIGADRFIERQPEGYAQDVRERGASLSHGQRQLLAFARALLYDPDVLVLDEATSSVDTETELLIQDALEKLREGRTALVIAHRLSTIRDAEQILVLHKGKLRERGTHGELLAEDGLYRKLYELQYKEEKAVER